MNNQPAAPWWISAELRIQETETENEWRGDAPWWIAAELLIQDIQNEGSMGD